MKKLLSWLDDHFEETLLFVFMWGIVIVMTLGVFFRYVMRNSLSWSDEMCRYFFIWFTFIGVSYAVKNSCHTRIDIIETLIPKLKKPLEYIGDALFFFFSCYILTQATSTWLGLMRSNQTSPAMRIPMWIIYLSFMLGFALTVVRFVEKYAKKLLHKGKEETI